MTEIEKTTQEQEETSVVETDTYLAMTKTNGKPKIVLGGAGSTPKKVRGTPTTTSKIPQTEAQITSMADKIMDHSQAVWGDIENTQREILVGIAERIAEDGSLKI